VDNATYREGINHREAEVVAEAVLDHAFHQADETLGVVAFNLAQANRIMDLVDNKIRSTPGLEEALAKLGGERAMPEPFFVKNLENVQGDERDTMFISTTYGRDPETGQVYNRFGPLLREAGWRRFNVLVTRAKLRMEVFTSLSEEDIRVEASSARGVRAFRQFLQYAATGRLGDAPSTSDREPESPFEVSVARVLRQMGFRCIPQVGVAGFFIDIGVKRPSCDDYIIGIECDGASYHSAKSTRDRDRLRQEILESLGWRIHRIWSVDWYKNREAEIARLQQVLQ